MSLTRMIWKRLEERSEAGKAALGKRLRDVQRGNSQGSVLGSMRSVPMTAPHIPTTLQANAASCYNGTVQHDVAKLIMEGNFLQSTAKMVSTDIVSKWTDSTVGAKARAVKLFMSFLEATGQRETFFPEDTKEIPKSASRRREEEFALCGFAILRVMAGQQPDGAEGYVSHVRTWYRTLWSDEFGLVGTKQTASITSQFLKRMRKFFPARDSHDTKRAPVTWPMIQMFMATARADDYNDAGVACAVAFAGLFRMGELTSTENRLFDPMRDLCESDLSFRPDFWNATEVIVQLRATKADQTGQKARLRPRFLPVDDNLNSPGKLLRDLSVRRHNTQFGVEPVWANTPLFREKEGGQLKRNTVMSFIRRTLSSAGFTDSQCKEYGTHSCRIGGATRLFQLGALPEVIQHLGGWSSEAYKEYVWIQQSDLMAFTRKICS